MHINAATTPEELDAIKSLRYLVNQQELQKSFLLKNEDLTDAQSVILYAKRNEAIIGSLRCTFKFDNLEIREYWGTQKPSFKSRVALVDRLVIHPTYRKTRVAYDLTTRIYKQALLEGCHIALIETEEHLIKMYEKIGFQVYREIRHDYGLRFQMFINPWDTAYLNAIKSPFFQEYTDYIKMVNGFTISTSSKVVA
ncbi:GNAT family N-acetyltransferase [Arcticibacterium luteifluviistationis]|uniref:N-acetyltransferase domain-containing protein n=1 Tax=Arcticibacterium luteifluviistationis TaxID=1784714 RepID=A0A2Z4G9N0_9BACT|nr:GNAT family N-acetyltransferase [Arcticibacterium luteifluviistationis]AWV97896.1 hypothetical protein DJ013_06835 [Arcticibacterium luteifluviistationis]